MTEYFLNCHTEESIRIRYKSLVKEYHPDKHPGEEEKYTKLFQEIEEERTAKLRKIYKGQGKSEQEIEEKIKNFIVEFASGRINASFMEEMAEHLDKKYNGKATFTDVVKEMFTGFLKAPNKKDLPNNPNQLNK